ncbi:MAG: YibE/F family protein [Bacillota bacterium]
MRKRLTVSVLFAVLLLLAGSVAVYAQQPEEAPDAGVPDLPENEAGLRVQTYRATVLDVEEEEVEESYFGGPTVEQRVKLRVDSGPWEGEREVINRLTGNPAYDIRVAPGDRVMVGGSDFTETEEIFIVDFVRDVPVAYLLGIFALSLVIIGGKRGAKTLVVLGLTALAVAYLLIPALLAGWNPMITTVVVSAIVVAFSLYIIAGATHKTAAAILGTVAGVLFAGILATLFGNSAHLMGLHTQEAQFLMFSSETPFDFRGLLFSGMILGALGAVMDVSISIASAVEEVHRVGRSARFSTLVRSGMNVGRDVLGTMSNTLILAYTGSSLPLILLLVAHRADFVSVANMDVIATEVIRALSGSVGLVLCVPVTAITAAWLKSRFAEPRSATGRRGGQREDV